MNIYYKIILVGILVYFLFNNLQESFEQQNFSIPKVKIHQVKDEQKKHKKSFFQYNPEISLETGQGVHDRIRYDGKWN